MTSERPSEAEIKCELLWKLCRRHGWKKQGVSREDLVTEALADTEQGRGRQLVGELLNEPYLKPKAADRYHVKNNPRAQAKAAFRLRDTCGYTDLQIESTLSRFQQAGGFEAFDRDEVLSDTSDW